MTTYSCSGTISLSEGVENHGKLVNGNTDTCVGDAELQYHVLVVHSQQPTAKSDMSLDAVLRRRELDGITDQVGDDLSETQGIANELVWDVWIDIVGQLQLVLGCADD